MLNVLIVSILLLSIFFGILSPKKAAWFIIISTPILGPGGFYFGTTSILPLTMYRISAFILLGVLLSSKYPIKKELIKNSYVKILFLFYLILFLLQVQHYPQVTITTLLPIAFIAITLPFIIIKSPEDLNKLICIFIIQGSIVASFIILEYVTNFNILTILRTNTLSEHDKLLFTKGFVEAYRSGYYRASGLFGNSVQTAYYLVFISPITFLYALKKGGIKGYLPIVLIVTGLVLLNSRAGNLVFLLLFFIILIKNIFFQNNRSQSSFKLLKIFITLIISFSFVMILIPDVYNISINFFSNIIDTFLGTQLDKELSPYGKIDRIPIALNIINQIPVLGYLVSPRYVDFYITKNADLPSIFFYIMAGGIVYGLFYLYHLFYMIYKSYNMSKNKIIEIYFSNLLQHTSLGILGGTLVTFSNYQEEHYLFMYILFISVTIAYKKTINKINFKI